MALVRICWMWGAILVFSVVGLPIVSMYNITAFIIFLITAVSSLLVTIPLMMPYVTTSIRMGRFLSVVSRRSLLRHVRQNRSVFVGEGWSFWLNYARPIRSRRIVSMSRSYAGVLDISSDRVICRSGTRLDDLDKALSDRGMTLEDRSQLDDMTVGGALKTGGHGCCTRVWFHELLLSFTYAVQGEGQMHRMSGTHPLVRHTVMRPDVVIFDVSLRITPNVRIALVNREISSCATFDWELYNSAQYRMLFVNSRELHAKLGILDAEVSSLIDGTPPLRAEFVRKSVAIRHQYIRSILLSDLHSYIGHIDIVEALMIPLLRYINVEFFVRRVSMPDIVSRLFRFHQKYKGRTEIRELASRQILALDVALQCPNKSIAIDELVRALHDEFGVRQVALHQGKYRLLNVSPLSIVDFDALTR